MGKIFQKVLLDNSCIYCKQERYSVEIVEGRSVKKLKL